MMRDADRMIGIDRRVPWDAPQGGHEVPWLADADRMVSGQTPLFAENEPEGLDTMVDVRSGPARGIVLAFGPAVLVWAGLVGLVAKLLQ